MNRMFKLTLALLAVLALTQIPNGREMSRSLLNYVGSTLPE